MQSKFPLIAVLGTALLLGGCFDELDDDDRPSGGGTPLNQSPSITGSPSANVLEGEFYEFLPAASDPDGDELAFSITRKPDWAQFDPGSGRLWGTPGAADVGNFTNIVISVSDGEASADLSGFDISVNALAGGQATLSWNPPTENSDGSTLTDLAGYRIYYGRNRDNLAQVIVVNNPGLTRYVVENLTPARWFFSMTSVDAEGTESTRSAVASKTIG